MHSTNVIRSFALDLLRSPAYLKALEARLLRGEAPELDAYRYAIFYGLIPQGIAWHPGLKRSVGQVWVNDRLVWRGQHVLLRDAVGALDEALLPTKL